MERLSKELTDIINEQDFCFTPDEMRTVKRALGRLRSYEDTGLTPDEIERILDAYGRGMTIRTENTERLRLIKDIQTDRLKDIAKAEKDGRLVVLPCKVGDTVYVVGTRRIIECFVVTADCGERNDIECPVLFECDHDCEGCPFGEWGQEYSGEWSCQGECGWGTIKGADFGKTVFLTRQEAEAALRREASGNE